jgi:ParB/RepB/Spo0J family partition protein
MLLPLEAIAVIDRGRKDLGDLSGLANSIKSNRQITAGVVRKAKPEDSVSEPFVLVAGERRYRACAIAGVPDFLCENFEDLDAETQYILELEENLHRKDLTWHEESTMRKRIHELKRAQAEARGERWTQEDTARHLGESVATISRDIQVAGALEKDPKLRDAGSKKAAVRVLDMRKHLFLKDLENMQAAQPTTNKLSELLVLADARDWLRAQPTDSVDLVLTDVPYGLGMDALYKADSDAARPVSEYNDDWAVTLDLYADIVPELLRITKLRGWICTTISESAYDPLREFFETCCIKHFEYGEVIWEQVEGGAWVKHMPTQCGVGGADCEFLRVEVPRWVWHRPNSQNPTRVPDKHAKNYYEPLLVLNRGAAKLYQAQCSNVLVFDADYGDERLHVMQKPRALGRELTQRFTCPGDLVVDPFFGSGSLLAGAAEVARKIKGCENNELMIDLAIGNVSKYHG